MSISDLGIEMYCSPEPFTVIPLGITLSVVDGRPTALPFRQKVNNLAQWSGGDDILAEQAEPLPVGFYAFAAVIGDYSSPDNPDIPIDEDEAETEVNMLLNEEIGLDDDEGGEEENSFTPEDIASGNGKRYPHEINDGIEDDQNTPNIRVNLDFTDQIEEAVFAAQSVHPEFAQHLKVYGIDPHMLLAAVYSYFDDGTRVQVGFLVQDTEDNQFEGHLLVFDGCYLAPYHAATPMNERSIHNLRVHSQQFAAELIGFLAIAGILPMRDDDEYTKQHLALVMTSPRMFNRDIRLDPGAMN